MFELPMDTVAQISSQLWDILGMPALLGLVTTWIVQKVKINPNIPFVQSGKTWVIRLFVTAIGTALQLAFYAIASRHISVEIVQEIALTYLTASTAYTHLFKVVSPNR